MDLERIKILSLNIGGLNDDIKRKEFIVWINQQNSDIICLQETKCSNQNTLNRWFFGSNYVTYGSFNGTCTSGVIILVRKEFSEICQAREIENDNEGRIIKISCHLFGLDFIISNIYAPAIHSLRKKFFLKLLEEYNEENLEDVNQEIDEEDFDNEEENLNFATDNTLKIICGDWNCIENPKIDKIGGNPESGDYGITELKRLIKRWEVEDWWRRRNPNLKSFSWERKGPGGLVRTRIDRIYTTNQLNNLIKNINHIRCPYSDHKAIELFLGVPKKYDIGDGYWKLSSKLLYNIEMETMIKNLMDDRERDENFGKIEWWENLKYELANKYKEEGKKIAKKENERIKNLEKELFSLDKQLIRGPYNQEIQEKYIDIKSKLQDLEKQKINGTIIRSRVKILEQNEIQKSFKKLEILKKINERIDSIKNTNGEIVKNQEEINQVAINFYQSLYANSTENNETLLSQEILLGKIENRITDLERKELNKDITKEEIIKAINKLKPNKSPGLDGLTNEFYKKYSKTLAKYLEKVFKDIGDKKEITKSMKQGLITLIFKKGEKEDIANYRPITLLNTDVKLISSILANRTNKVISKVIGEDQKAIKGSYILENVRIIQDYLEYIKYSGKKEKGILVFLDQEKAFDRVKWSFLVKVIDKFGFGENFTSWIQTLYKGISSKLKINNFITDSFNIERGVRQGDCLSPILFVIIIETLANAIRKDPEFCGLPIPKSNSKIKIKLYADDTVIFIQNGKDIERMNYWIKIYSIASDAKINKSKTEALSFNIKDPPDLEFKIDNSKSIKYLGILIGWNVKDEDIWNPIIQKMEKEMAKIKLWSLTLKGRINCFKSLILSKIYYTLNTQSIPLIYKKKIQLLMWKFINNNKNCGFLRRSILEMPIEAGGLNAPNIDLIENTIKIRWIQRLLGKKEIVQDWKEMAFFHIRNLFSEWGVGLSGIFGNINLKNSQICTKFWIECIDSIRKIWKQTLDLNYFDILAQPLWGNKLIGNGINMPKYKKLANHGIIRIRDIWFNNKWATSRLLEKYYLLQIDQNQIDYIINSIPQIWKKEIENYQIDYKDSELWEYNEITWRVIDQIDEQHFIGESYDRYEIKKINHKYRPVILENNKKSYLDLMEFSINEKEEEILLLNNKKIMKLLQYQKLEIIPNLIKWNQSCQYIFEWKKIFKRIWKNYAPAKFNQVYYLIIQRKLWIGERFQRLGMDHETNCKLCGKLETFEHLLVECQIAQVIWKKISFLDINIVNIINGQFPNVPKKIRPIITIIHRIAIWTIWTIRNQITFQKNTINQKEMISIYNMTIKNVFKTIIISKRFKTMLNGEGEELINILSDD